MNITEFMLSMQSVLTINEFSFFCIIFLNNMLLFGEEGDYLALYINVL